MAKRIEAKKTEVFGSCPFCADTFEPIVIAECGHASICRSCKNAGMDINVKEIMDTWTLQMGFPVVTMTKRDVGGSWMVDADQTWFLVDPQADKSKDEYGSVFK